MSLAGLGVTHVICDHVPSARRFLSCLWNCWGASLCSIALADGLMIGLCFVNHHCVSIYADALQCTMWYALQWMSPRLPPALSHHSLRSKHPGLASGESVTMHKFVALDAFRAGSRWLVASWLRSPAMSPSARRCESVILRVGTAEGQRSCVCRCLHVHSRPMCTVRKHVPMHKHEMCAHTGAIVGFPVLVC